MLLDFSLKNIFDRNFQCASSPVDIITYSFLENGSFDVESAYSLLGNEVDTGDPFAVLDAWRDLFVINLMCRGNEALSSVAVRRARFLMRFPFWDEVPLLQAYAAVNSHLLQIDFPSLQPWQSEEGGVPFETGGYWPWAGVPHPKYHAELGLLWVILSMETGDDELSQAAERLARWQFNTLDHNFEPFVGLFTREEDASLSCQLVNNYLLFHAIALLTESGHFEYVADRQREHLWRLKSEDVLRSPSSWSMMAAFYLEAKAPAPDPKNLKLPSNFSDNDFGLVGQRGFNQSAVATLRGGGTSMGALSRGDLKVVSFGPQALPLGDCSGYGIEGMGVKVDMNSQEDRFDLVSRVRLTGICDPFARGASFRSGGCSGVWMDVKESLLADKLSISVDLMSVEKLENLAFVFYIKAKKCLVGGGMNVRPRSLDRYQGEVVPVTFLGSHDLNLEVKPHFGQMEVIPLASEESFWGADFLVAYILDSRCQTWTWKIQ